MTKKTGLFASLLATGVACASALSNPLPHPTLVETAQATLEKHIRQQLPADAQTHMQWQWSAPRGAATAPCHAGWSIGNVELRRLQRIQVPAHCGAQRGSIVAHLTLQAPMWTLVRDLPADSLLQKSDLAQRMHTLDSLQQLQPLEALLGARLRKAQRTGAVLGVRDVERPQVVRRGDKVEIRATEAGVTVHAMGEALAAARLGDSVRVRNVRSQTIVTGQLVEPKVVLVTSTPPNAGVKVVRESND